jgi:hypothetical protein
MSYLRCSKRSWAWLAIIALVAHALVSAAPTGVSRADNILGPLVICTADGAKVTQGDGAPNRVPAAAHCLACMPPVQLMLATDLVALPVAFPPIRATPFEATRTIAVAVHLITGGIHSRGPPHAA